MIGSYAENTQVEMDSAWGATSQAAAEVSGSAMLAACPRHSPDAFCLRICPTSEAYHFGSRAWIIPRLNTSRHIVFNLTQPNKSILTLAPAQRRCRRVAVRDPKTGTPSNVFTSPSDPDYRTLVAMSTAGQHRLAASKQFDMRGFKPRLDWVREMKRYGILDAGTLPDDEMDVSRSRRQRYWKSLWYWRNRQAR